MLRRGTATDDNQKKPEIAQDALARRRPLRWNRVSQHVFDGSIHRAVLSLYDG
nr:hypothetical protein [Candidatus Sigynarchaeum springense]